jgi:hypothetical protein
MPLGEKVSLRGKYESLAGNQTGKRLWGTPSNKISGKPCNFVQSYAFNSSLAEDWLPFSSGIAYRSSIHDPKSMSLHRFEQKGR